MPQGVLADPGILEQTYDPGKQDADLVGPQWSVQLNKNRIMKLPEEICTW